MGLVGATSAGRGSGDLKYQPEAVNPHQPSQARNATAAFVAEVRCSTRIENAGEALGLTIGQSLLLRSDEVIQ